MCGSVGYSYGSLTHYLVSECFELSSSRVVVSFGSDMSTLEGTSYGLLSGSVFSSCSEDQFSPQDSVQFPCSVLTSSTIDSTFCTVSLPFAEFIGYGQCIVYSFLVFHYVSRLFRML